MKTLGAKRPEKQLIIARDTLVHYVTLADYLGMKSTAEQLRSLSKFYLGELSISETAKLEAQTEDVLNTLKANRFKRRIRENYKKDIEIPLARNINHNYSTLERAYSAASID